MDLRLLRYFVAVAEENNFGAAARRLNVTQPPVTRSIQALEHELRVQLLVRTAKGATLTQAGRVFLDEAREILARAQRAAERSRAAARGEIGQLSVASFGSPIQQVVPSLLRRFRERVPHVEITLITLPKSRQVLALRAGTVDIGFGRYFPAAGDIVSEVVSTERLYVALRAEDAPRTASTLRSLDSRPIVLFPTGERPGFADTVLDLFEREGIRPVVGAEAEDSITALALVAIGAGACIVPQSVAATMMPGVRFVPLRTSQPASVPVHCVYLRANRSPMLAALLEGIREHQKLAAAADGDPPIRKPPER